MSFKDIEFGTTDAETELVRTPLIFDKSFFDPHSYLSEIRQWLVLHGIKRT